MSDFVIAQIRTWTPILVGAFLTWLASYGLDLFTVTEEMIILVTALFSGVYYLIVRLLAEWKPAFGVLLGVNKAPEYAEPS